MAESFDQVRVLGEPELRALIEHGRPEERVWAIWALALRSDDAVGELARREEPDAGVRRTLAVLLAGHGELDLLVALARRDPAPEVRAAAMQLVARLALDGRLPTSLVIERAGADGPEVRIAILGVVFAGAPPWLMELAINLLEDREPEVRYEAFEALVRCNEPDARARLARGARPKAKRASHSCGGPHARRAATRNRPIACAVVRACSPTRRAGCAACSSSRCESAPGTTSRR